MLELSPDFDEAIEEARYLLSPGRIVMLYTRLRIEFPSLPKDPVLSEMMWVVMTLGVMQTVCTQVKVTV